ncbi:MAG TPA: folylpolyglutamate synthase/dihydrofolate synthase family protein [Spirochaetales bacterium]|nr:folylpolyglutamate synthase/dihydrofolate synthase family protein [Spirochaetales bacterium]
MSQISAFARRYLTTSHPNTHALGMSHAPFSSSDEVFAYVMNYVNVEKGQKTEFKLDRMRWLAEALGNPQLGRLTIHVAGSKGKGSVATMCACILKAKGYKTGLYTSPHILRWKERIALADEEIPESTLIEAAEEVIALIDGRKAQDFPGDELPTYFELTTLIGFCAFRLAGCNAQVIEVGMGGRLDSTNIVVPDMAVITPIELEHTQYLGDTIAKIAGEKAGIIKNGKPVCISPQKPEALEVFVRTAAQRECPLFYSPDIIDIRECSVNASGTDCLLVPKDNCPTEIGNLITAQGLRVHSPMPGKVQCQNMALAALACALTCEVSYPSKLPYRSKVDDTQTLSEFSHKQMREAVTAGLSAASLPARFEPVKKEPLVIVDGAHTPNSVSSTLDTFLSLVAGRRTLLFGCAIDKKYRELVKILAPHFASVIVTKPGNFKESDPEIVYEAFKDLGTQVELVPDTREAIAKAIARASQLGAGLLVTGSFYLCAEVKSYLGS